MCEGVESTKHRENDELRLLAFGATRPQAVAALLLLHVLLTGATMLLTGFLLLLLWWPLRVHQRISRPWSLGSVRNSAPLADHSL
jgi:hypothetical protein